MMKQENEMDHEVKQLLESLTEHRRNEERKRQLSELLDQLSEQENTVAEESKKTRKLAFLWWVSGAAAAYLLLWVLFQPFGRPSMDKDEKMLAHDHAQVDSVVGVQHPAMVMEIAQQQEKMETQTLFKISKPKVRNTKQIEFEIPEPKAEEILLAETRVTDIIDSSSINKELVAQEITQPEKFPSRRVIKSENLVGYVEPKPKQTERKRNRNWEDKIFLGLQSDPNMQNGSLAYEIKF